MKTYLPLAILAGTLVPISASAQLSKTLIDNSTTPGTNVFHNLIIEMNADVLTLKTNDSGSGNLSIDDPIYWDWNGNGLTGSWEGSSFLPGSYDLQFQKFTTNPDFFSLAANQTVNIGYIGNESNNDNELYVSLLGSTRDLLLFDYDSGDPNSTDDAPISYTLSYTMDQAYDIVFEHDSIDDTDAPLNFFGNQSSEAKFKIYQAYGRTSLTGQLTALDTYLLAIGDEEGDNDTDYDDGFFLVQFGDTPVVPEPSHIAAAALLGMTGLLLLRRRFGQKK